MELSDRKVVLGLSGGVDSAVAAHILKDEGYDVTGVYLDIGLTPPDDACDAAEAVGIDFRVIDIRQELEDKVCVPFCRAYLDGHTPNPCILCNPTVKFRNLIDVADEIGAKYVSTGHYARTEERNGKMRLVTAKSVKDQTYMLYRLPYEWLSRLIFPLGEFASKDEVREMARSYGLTAAEKSDSMEICFVPDGDYAAFIENRGIFPPEGNFVDTNGNILGRHRGIHHYTIGKRRHLGICAGERVYVKAIDRVRNEVVICTGDDVYLDKIMIGGTNWLTGGALTLPLRCEAKVRYSHLTYPATIDSLDGGCAHISFDSPVRAPTSGQSAVFYDGDALIGGGFIK